MKQTSISNLNTKTVVNDDDYLIVDNLSSTNKILAKTILDTCKQELLNNLYPIGSIYMSVNSANPSTLFGGTWEKIKDKFLLASGDSYELGSVGGEATHTLTTSEMPSHTHETAKGAIAPSSDKTFGAYSTYQAENSINPGKYWYANVLHSGGGQPHNNLPPYLVVNIWKRTA